MTYLFRGCLIIKCFFHKLQAFFWCKWIIYVSQRGRKACPSHIVREQLAKVTRDHVEYVLENLRKSAPKITNIRNYLLCSLFNAVDMMDSHYSLQVRHEMTTGDMFAKLEVVSPDCSTTAEELQ